ncbi:hypothetical protein T484DRAFT_1835961 [Baffinella frigidus]|nr:hypothetical protein T484DRAFT_1835961 [Cryptophyta sp. CCMP2293]
MERKDKQPEQWQLPPEKPSFPGWHLALVKSVVGTTPDGGSMLMPASDAPGEDDGVEQSTELLLQLMSLFQKKHGRMPTEEEVRQWGDVFRTTVVESQRAKMSGKSAQKVVHISGLYVDLEKVSPRGPIQ